MAGIPVYISRVGSILTAFFAAGPVTDYESARSADTERFGEFFRSLLEWGVYWPPSQFEAAFVSLAHSDDDIEATIKATEKALMA